MEIASSSSGVSPLVPIAPTTSPSDDERDAARQRDGAVQGERAQAPARDLLLQLAARPHEDGGGARLVDGDARACDLRAFGAAQLDDLAVDVDHDHDHAVAPVVGEGERRVDDRVGALRRR